MGHSQFDDAIRDRAAWNAGKKVGTKRPFTQKQIWAIRFFLDRESRVRDRALFDLAIDSKLRGCDLVKIRIRDVVAGPEILRKGLLEKRPAMGTDPVWKEESGKGVTLVISKTGLAACGIESVLKASVAAKQDAVAGVSDDEPRMPRAGSKLAILIGLLEREGGATVEEMVAATGWQAHSVRGVMSATLQKRFGFEIGSERVEGGQTVYKASSC